MGMHIDRMNGVSRAYSVPIVRIVKAMQFQLGLSSTSPHSPSLSITGKENLFFNLSHKAKASMKRKA